MDVNNKSVAAQFVQKTMLLANKITGIDIVTWLSSFNEQREVLIDQTTMSNIKTLSQDLGINQNDVEYNNINELLRRIQSTTTSITKITQVFPSTT
eukprot:UN05570